MSHIIAPSILAADFLNLQRDIQLVNDSQADWLHIDVMDGRFVPNISFGQPVVKAMKSACTKVFDIHLMIEEPQKYIPDFAEMGADYISFHVEATNHVHRAIQLVKSFGVKCGVALNPHTPVEVLYDVLGDLDMVVLMSVNPGFGGQKFIPRTIAKIQKLAQEIKTQGVDTLIEIDGGVGLANAEQIINAGANVLVAGSSVFKSENPKDAIVQLKQITIA